MFSKPAEGKMTPRVMSILKRYEDNGSNEINVSPTNSGEGSQTMNMKRKRLTEAILLRNKCQARNLMSSQRVISNVKKEKKRKRNIM